MISNQAASLIFNKIINILFSALLIITPLIFVTGTNELFEFPKTYFIYFFGSTTIFIFLLKKIWLWEKIYIPKNFVLAFVIVYLAATIFSMHFFTSMWGYFSRFNGSLVSILIYFGLYIVAINDFKKPQFSFMSKLALIPTLPMGIYGILQHFGFVSDIWKADQQIRIFSTIGQPNWLGAYIAMLIPSVFWNILSTPGLFLLWFVAYIICFSTLWFTYSMSSILSFFIGVTAFLILNKKAIKNGVILKYFILLLFATILIAGLNPGIFRQRAWDAITDFKKFISIEKVAKAADEYNISDTGSIRKNLWTSTLKLIFSSPKNFLIGTGPETYPYAFQQFRPKEINYTSEWDIIFNKPHNFYLEIFSNVGIFGLVFYIAIIYKTLKMRHKIITPTLLSLYITNFFGWPTVSTSLLFWFYIAYLEVAKNE